MTHDTRTPDDIERDIADERAEMAGTISDLQKKFSVEAIVNDLGNMIRDQGGDIGRTISNTVARNPAAVALIAAGLAWLLIGQGRKRSAESEGRDGVSSDQWGRGTTPTDRTADGPFQYSDSSWFDDARVTSQDPRSRRSDMPSTSAVGSQRGDSSDSLVGAVRRGAGAAADAVSDAAGSVRDSAGQLTERLSRGTEAFSDEARARVLSARQKANDARNAARGAVGRGGRAASNLFEDQPLVVGALAVAVGAAIGGALPRSRLEDDNLGESSDQLFADAQAVFFEERDKAAAVLKTVAKDAKSELRDAGSDLADRLPDAKTAGNTIVDRVDEATSRVVSSAKTEAEKQGLGQRKT